MLKKLCGLALLCLALVLPASAEQVYVRNKPFKGPVQGGGKQIAVELQSMVAALGMSLTEVSGNLVVTRPGETATLPEGVSGSGHIYCGGKDLGEASQGPQTMVSLYALGQAAGARVTPNPSLGTVDVNLAVAAAPKGGTNSGGLRIVNFTADW